MTSIRVWFVVLMLAGFASFAGADVRCPTPGIGGPDVPRQQATTGGSGGGSVTDEELEEDEDEEPDCD